MAYVYLYGYLKVFGMATIDVKTWTIFLGNQ